MKYLLVLLVVFATHSSYGDWGSKKKEPKVELPATAKIIFSTRHETTRSNFIESVQPACDKIAGEYFALIFGHGRDPDYLYTPKENYNMDYKRYPLEFCKDVYYYSNQLAYNKSRRGYSAEYIGVVETTVYCVERPLAEIALVSLKNTCMERYTEECVKLKDSMNVLLPTKRHVVQTGNCRDVKR